MPTLEVFLLISALQQQTMMRQTRTMMKVGIRIIRIMVITGVS